MISVILTADGKAVGLDCLIVRPCHYRESHVLGAAQDEGIE